MPRLHEYAQSLGLDMARYTAEMDDEIYLQRIREHQQSGRASGVRSTPGFFVNGRIQDVSYGLDSLSKAVEAALHV
jgi:protein-disulfide isomerase